MCYSLDSDQKTPRVAAPEHARFAAPTPPVRGSPCAVFAPPTYSDIANVSATPSSFHIHLI